MAAKKSVLFVCLGNLCRSQMAEGFARAYGSDVLEASSAGLLQCFAIPGSTYKAMEEKNIGLAGQFPKRLDELRRADYDMVVNMSGQTLPPDLLQGAVEEWQIEDPMGRDEDVFRRVRDEIEMRVMRLILTLRRDASGPSPD